jgi:hypothetical protein
MLNRNIWLSVLSKLLFCIQATFGFIVIIIVNFMLPFIYYNELLVTVKDPYSYEIDYRLRAIQPTYEQPTTTSVNDMRAMAPVERQESGSSLASPDSPKRPNSTKIRFLINLLRGSGAHDKDTDVTNADTHTRGNYSYSNIDDAKDDSNEHKDDVKATSSSKSGNGKSSCKVNNNSNATSTSDIQLMQTPPPPLKLQKDITLGPSPDIPHIRRGSASIYGGSFEDDYFDEGTLFTENGIKFIFYNVMKNFEAIRSESATHFSDISKLDTSSVVDGDSMSDSSGNSHVENGNTVASLANRMNVLTQEMLQIQQLLQQHHSQNSEKVSATSSTK